MDVEDVVDAFVAGMGAECETKSTEEALFFVISALGSAILTQCLEINAKLDTLANNDDIDWSKIGL